MSAMGVGAHDPRGLFGIGPSEPTSDSSIGACNGKLDGGPLWYCRQKKTALLLLQVHLLQITVVHHPQGVSPDLINRVRPVIALGGLYIEEFHLVFGCWLISHDDMDGGCACLPIAARGYVEVRFSALTGSNGPLLAWIRVWWCVVQGALNTMGIDRLKGDEPWPVGEIWDLDGAFVRVVDANG